MRSGHGSLQEVITYKRFQYSDLKLLVQYFGKQVAENEVVTYELGGCNQRCNCISY